MIDPEGDGPMAWALRQTPEYKAEAGRSFVERANAAAQLRIAELELEIEHAKRTVVPMMSMTEDQALLVKSVTRIRDLELSLSERDGRIMMLEAERDGLKNACSSLRGELSDMRYAALPDCPKCQCTGIVYSGHAPVDCPTCLGRGKLDAP